MRALTIQQPWAWAVATGSKDIENRSRSLGPYRGQVAIHAGAQWSHVGARDPRVREAFRPFQYMDESIHQRIDPALHSEEFTFGAVIAVGDLAGTHSTSQCFDAGCRSRWANLDGIGAHLVLADIRRFRQPVPAKGRLGLWTLPEDVEVDVLAELARSTAEMVADRG